ncbi:MAG: hypothetical protein ACREF3_17325 [Acetobacteraceae bacterium]
MPRLHLLRIGLLASLLALAGQLAFGATVPAVGLSSLGVICHAGAAHGKPVPPWQHDPGCLLCPLCATLIAPGPILVPSPMLPRPRAVAAEPASVSPAQSAQVVTIPAAAQPRGPPSLA